MENVSASDALKNLLEARAMVRMYIEGGWADTLQNHLSVVQTFVEQSDGEKREKVLS